METGVHYGGWTQSVYWQCQDYCVSTLLPQSMVSNQRVPREARVGPHASILEAVRQYTVWSVCEAITGTTSVLWHTLQINSLHAAIVREIKHNHRQYFKGDVGQL